MGIWHKENKYRFGMSHDQNLVCTAVQALDYIEQMECSKGAAISGLALILQAMDYPELESHASAIEVITKLFNEFQHSYFVAETINKKMLTIMSAVSTAEKLIEEKNIDETIKEAVAEELTH